MKRGRLFGWVLALSACVTSGGAVAQTVADGETLFKRQCAVCHNAAAGAANKVGPNLWGLLGRKSGTIEGFKYSEANKNSGIVWSPETLDPYLENPRKEIPNTTMAFVGIRKPEDRKAMIEYLATLK